MTILTREQAMDLLVGAGFKKTSPDTATMIGIMYAESGGDPTKYNGVNKDSSYGLWQINMKGSLGPDRRKKFGIASNDQLFDPKTNAHAAYIVYKDSGLSAWTTYTRGTYLKYMDDTTGREDGHDSDADTGGIENPVSDIPNAITSAVNSLGGNLFKGAANLSGIILAIALLVVGVVLLARKPLANVLPAGKALKAVKAVTS